MTVNEEYLKVYVEEEYMDLDSLFDPRSIAVIGASGRQGSVGYIYLDSIVSSGYEGKVYPVNPRYDELLGLQCYDSIESIGNVDLAVIATNKMVAIDLLENCANVGVKAAVIPTGGFEEVGEEGAELERKIREIASENGMALLGTNTLGFINNHIGLQINFNPRLLPSKGNVSIISQSGGMGLSIISKLREEGVGMSKWIGVGNRTLLDFPEFLEYLAKDESTTVIGAFMEGTERAKQFCELAARIVPHKPVVVYKMGKSASVDYLAVTHTGTGIGKTGAYKGAFRQHGVLTADSTRDLVAKLKALAIAGRIGGKQLGMFTYTAGPTIAAADLLNDHFTLPQPSEETIRIFEDFMKGAPPTILKNPMDVDGQGYTPESYQYFLNAYAADPGFDLLATVSTAGLLFPKDQLLEAKKGSGKPILHCHVADSIEIFGSERDQLHEAGIPIYTTAEELAVGLIALSEYMDAVKRILERGNQQPQIMVSASHFGDSILDEHESKMILAEAGLPVVEERVVSSREEMVKAEEELGFPLVLKVLSRRIAHKSDVGAVRTDIIDHETLMETWNSFKKKWPSENVLVQRMIHGGVEIIVGRILDPVFGDIITLGVGGFMADLFSPSAGVCPCTRQDCISIIDALEPQEILNGYRGTTPVDRNALADLMEKVSRIHIKDEKIDEMDLNPVIVKGDSLSIVDALIRKGE
ncbi:MAG: acetate--CoA ligase family protein [Methanomassiliicoccales archaeon]|nr:acetate--CoA ligase family protein [Methanomassiliicoccales archaeon]